MRRGKQTCLKRREAEDGRLETPNRIRELQRGLYLKAKRERALACLEVKMIGKPSGGKLHAGFDEGDWTAVYEQP